MALSQLICVFQSDFGLFTIGWFWDLRLLWQWNLNIKPITWFRIDYVEDLEVVLTDVLGFLDFPAEDLERKDDEGTWVLELVDEDLAFFNCCDL